MTSSAACPCCSGEAFDRCCGPFLAGGEAPTPEALMRSRFTAFARHDAAYLIRTSDMLLASKLTPRAFADSFRRDWHRLEVLAAQTIGQRGCVRFRAHWRLGIDSGVLEESSRFNRRADGWRYVDGRGTL